MGGKHPSQANQPFSAITLKGKPSVQKCDEAIDNHDHKCNDYDDHDDNDDVVNGFSIMPDQHPIITIATMHYWLRPIRSGQ